MSVYKTIAKNFAANSFGMGVNFLNQIAMVPLFILNWGVEKYADWILITAFSAFFAMTDLGLNRASNNDFVIKYQQKDYASCKRLQANAFIFVLFIFVIFISSSILISQIWGFNSILSINSFSETETSFAFMVLLSEVFFNMYGRVYHGIFRATSHTHIAIIIDNIVRLGVLLILFIGVTFHLDINLMLCIYIIPTIGGIICKHHYSNKIFKIKFSFQNFNFPILKSLIGPSLAFMMFPLGQAVSSQGIVLVVNTLLGPTILVAFTTTRTFVNFLRQVMNMLSTSINPEICAAFGRHDIKTIKNIYYRSLVITFIITTFSIILMLLAGEHIYTAWTKHTIAFNQLFFACMLLSMLVSCLWGISSVIPLSTNTHGPFTIAFLITQFFTVIITYLLLTIYPNLEIIPITILSTEILLFVFTLKQNNKFLNINFWEMLTEISHQIKFLLNKGKLLNPIVILKKYGN
ncbi:O-antigen/teichoic acid export membrane protein [Dyadobacter jejuensis]|uniref:O-antigen/teichoic acid export membrane protein n=1 Tax=Dyadobacter jejuensis TaxID=1082580 RepID=A0A316AGA3_9BACT|nr:hypothetical protein [Dyadobacter jejuensis]PWJ55990.1 O-antigen/teichoic acid export membrane protein [Dyadobacter jejuensis]